MLAAGVLMGLCPGLMISQGEARVRPHYGGEVRVETSATGMPEFVKLLVADRLTYVDVHGDVKAGLAVRWESQNGFRRWQFWLRPGMRMHGTDGDVPLTMEMVADAIRAGLAKDGMNGHVQVANDAMAVEFSGPMPQFAALLAGAQYGVTTGDGHGSGPYMVQSVVGSRMTLVANPEYWGGQRFAETITVLCGRAAREQALDLAAKHADLVEVGTEELRRAGQDRVRLSQIQATEVIALSAERARTADVKLRQALSESIDRPALLNFIFQKQGEAAGGLLPNWISGYGSLLTPVRNAAHARQLRTEAGGRGALTLGYEAGDAELQLVAERIALNAREAGLTTQAVGRTSDVDWILRRITVRTANPAAALTGILQEVHGAIALDDATLESVFRAERTALADYTLLPLVHLNKAWAAGERLHDWSNANAIVPLPAESWVETKP